MMKTPSRQLAAALVLALALGACRDHADALLNPPPSESTLARAAHGAPPPSPLVTVTAGGAARTLWPYTGTDFRGVAEAASDPINVIFTGHADPRSIRAALMSLDGNRAGYLPPPLPTLPFFQCTWRDAMGGNQSAYGEPEGWTGSAIQLECGEYQGLRFHLRLFAAAGWTVANAHFETVIPRTHDHQVLSWDLAKQLVTADLARAALLAAPPSATPVIHPTPSFRTIHPLIYYDPAFAPLHPIINAVVDPANPQSIGIRTDGTATVLQLGRTVEGTPGTARQELVIDFGQVIPKPVCAGPTDYIFVSGPLHLRQDVILTPSGLLRRNFHVEGELTVVPVNPITGQPLGPPAPARIEGLYTGQFTDVLHATTGELSQTLAPAGGPLEQLVVDLRVGPHGLTRYSRTEQCP